MSYNCRHSFLFHGVSTSGGGQGGGSPEEQRAGSGSRNKEGDSLLFMTEYYSVKKHLYSKVLKFPFNIHQCLKENFGSKET